MDDSDQLISGSENKPEQEAVKKPIFKTKWFRIGLGLTAGAFAGVMYWNFIGCNGGSCPLTFNPVQTIILFSVMGGWISYK
jgi:hypothetical protein